jgi:uncharacterized protein
MKVSASDSPNLVSGLYRSEIKNSNILYYNPEGFGGVTVIDAEIEQILHLCDGKRSLELIAQILGVQVEGLLPKVQVLSERELLYVSNDFTAYIHQRKPSKKLACWVHLTNSCNLACGYCYIHKSSGNLTIDDGKKLIEKMLLSAEKALIPEISLKFAGGEPLLRLDVLKEMVRFAEAKKGGKKFSYNVLTNGTLITPAIAGYLAEKGVGVGVSLDGLREANDAARPTRAGSGSFDLVLEGIRALRECGIEPSINITVSMANILDLVDVTGFLLDLGLRFRYSLERDIETGMPQIINNQELVVGQLMKCYDLIENVLPKQDIMLFHQFGDTVFSRPISRSCGAAGNFFAVGHDGSLGVCGLGLATPKGNLHDQGDLLQNIREANFELFSSSAKSYEGCSECY